jgi:two-component system chemotaxis response regulator CheB
MSKNMIVIGASAGGIEALRTLFGALPGDIPASIFVVVHVSPQSPSVLPQIFSRAGDVSVVSPRDWEEIRPGQIYVAPPDHHLIIEPPAYVRLTRGPKENRFRPAVDPLFRSAARAFGPRVIGVVLSGGLDDGTAGLLAIKRQGGITVVQDPHEAYAPSMPLNALKHVKIDHCLPVSELAPLLVRLASEPYEEKGAYAVPENMKLEIKIAREDRASETDMLKWGEKSIYTCPECHGTLLEMKESGLLRFR